MAPDLGIEASAEDDIVAKLSKDFPEVDTTVILALLSDTDDRSQASIDALTADLSALAVQAKSEILQAKWSPTNDDAQTVTSSYLSDPFFYREDLATAPSSASSNLSVSPSLEFLMTAFPDLPIETLQLALDERKVKSGEDLDMASLVQELLSWELLQEFEERGVDDARSDDQDWSAVEVPKSKSKKKAKASANGKKITLGDVRQQSKKSVPPKLNTGLVIDNPWASFSSLATRLSELLPPLPPAHFLSLFHNPKSSSPSNALLAELRRLGASAKPIAPGSLDTLLELIDTKGPQDVDDARLCLSATPDNLESAWDLYSLLKDLDRGALRPAYDTPSTSASGAIISGPRFSVAPVTPYSPSSPLLSSSPSAYSPSSPQAGPSSPWVEVAPRSGRNKNREREIDPLAQFIPSYGNMPAGWRQNSGRGIDEPDDDEDAAGMSASECREWAQYYRDKRDIALKEASKQFRSGANRAGDVAFYYADESRRLDQKSRKWAMRAAKALVSTRQTSSNTRNSVDLHGLTVKESLHVVREAVNHWWNSEGGGSTPRTSLHIITGKGNHSKHKVSVIGPAVIKALESDGWKVSKNASGGAINVVGLKSASR